MALELKRHCPGCLDGVPGKAYFEYTGGEKGTSAYACMNCGHEITVRHRPPKLGSAAQREAIDRLTKLALPRFEVIGRGATVNGRVMVGFSPRKWYDGIYFATVGPRGGLRFQESFRKTKTGRGAWISARVYLGA